MVVAETPRLLIRTLTSEDVPALAAIMADPAVMRFSTRGVRSEEETRQFIQWCIESYAIHGVGQWAVVDRASSALIGFCGLSPVVIDGVRETEIGYRFARTEWGRGIATEAAASVVAFGFEQARFDSIIAIIAADHRASIRVARKVGFSAYTDTRYEGWDVRVYRMCSDGASRG